MANGVPGELEDLKTAFGVFELQKELISDSRTDELELAIQLLLKNGE